MIGDRSEDYQRAIDLLKWHNGVIEGDLKSFGIHINAERRAYWEDRIAQNTRKIQLFTEEMEKQKERNQDDLFVQWGTQVPQ